MLLFSVLILRSMEPLFIVFTDSVNQTLKMEHTSAKKNTSRFIWYREHHRLQLELAAILNFSVPSAYSRGSYKIVRQRGTELEV